MVYARPIFEALALSDWRTVAHSASAAEEWTRARERSPDDIGFALEVEANRFAADLIFPKISVDISHIKTLAELHVPVFEPGTWAFNKELTGLREAVSSALSSEFNLQIINWDCNRWIGGPRQYGRDVSLVLSRREMGRVIHDALDLLRTKDGSQTGFRLNAWFRIRVRGAIQTGRARLSVRMSHGRGVSHSAPTMHDWTRLFLIHTGFSPPSTPFAHTELALGGKIESDCRPRSCLDHRTWRSSGHSAVSCLGRPLESQPASRRTQLDYHWRLHLGRADRARALRCADRRPLGTYFCMGLRQQPRIRARAGAVAE